MVAPTLRILHLMSRRSGILSSAPIRVLLSVLTTVLLGAATAVGQSGDANETGEMHGESGTPKGKGGTPGTQYLYRDNGVVEITTNPDQTQTERIVPPAEVKELRRRNLIPRIHAAKLFTATVSSRPRQLAPGETGVLHVLVVLASDTVVLPGSKILVKVFGDTLPVTLGNSRIVPARKGTLPGHFRDALVYDDIVEIRVPVTIKSDAAAKKYPISGHVEIEVHNGTTGQLIGEFYSGIDGWLKVGRSLATAATTTGRQARESNSHDGQVGARTRSTPGPGHGAATGRGEREPDGVGDADAADVADAAAPIPMSDEGLDAASDSVMSAPTTLLVFGSIGLALLGLIVVLLARRRAA